MLRRWMVGGLSVVLLASALLAKPGVVTNRQGETFNGDITEDAKFVYINGAGGQIKLDKRNIASVVYAETIDDQYAARHAKLAANDVKGRMDLAQWANDNNRADLAVAALTEARKIDPMNKDAGRALDAAQQQLDMDLAAAKAKAAGAATAPATTAATGKGAAPAPATQQSATAAPLQRRLLTSDEINTIRQKEMQPDDPDVKVMFAHNVIRRYLTGADHDPAQFNRLSKQEQAMDILAHGNAGLANDVRITTDPAPLLEFKKKVYPIISTGCASSACHGGTKAGDFVLFPGDSNPAVYTNFYILLNYSATIGGVKYLALDRDVPTRSLVLQFGLPQMDGMPPHPKLPMLRPVFKSTTDPRYEAINNWMTRSLAVLQPDYGIHVAFSMGGPTTKPMAAPPTTAPVKPPATVKPVKPMK